MSGMTTLIAVVALGTSVLVPAVSYSTLVSSRNNPPVEAVVDDKPESLRAAISSMLQEASSKIQDEDIKKYYNTLIGEYGLEEPPSDATQEEYTNPEDILPDIERIQRAALTLPLREAGKHIRDKEIAEFYYKFLKDSGWKINPGD